MKSSGCNDIFINAANKCSVELLTQMSKNAGIAFVIDNGKLTTIKKDNIN